MSLDFSKIQPANTKIDQTTAKAALGHSTHLRMNLFKSTQQTVQDEQQKKQTDFDQSKVGFASNFGKAMVKNIVDPAVKFGASAIRAPIDMFNSLRGKPVYTGDIKLPSGETSKTIQAQSQEDINNGGNALDATGKVVADTVGGAGDVLGAAEIGGSKIVQNTLSKVTGPVGDLISKASSLAKKGALGKEGVAILEKLNNPEVTKFIPEIEGGLGKTFDEVAKNVSGAVEKFQDDSKSALKSVKDSIPDIQVDPSKIIDKVNEGIMNSIKNNADYKGIKSDVSLFDNPKDLVNSGLLDDSEVKKVNGMVDAIKNWKDTSARGVLNLKEQLDSFYKYGSDNSNSILSNIQKGLKDIVGEAHPAIKEALETASNNIDKAKEFTQHLIGSSDIQGETKLSSIAKNLKNPAAGGGKLSLLDDLKNATGYDAMPELKGYSDFLSILGKDAEDIPSKAGVITKNLGKRLGITGGIAAAGAEVKRLLGF